MNSLIASKASGLRSVLVSAAILLVSSTRAAQPTFDPQEQARAIIAPTPTFPATRDSVVIVSATASAQGNCDLDAQAQARRFIAQSILSSVIESRSHVRPLSAQGNARIDAQEQARQFILAKPNFPRLSGAAVLSVSSRQRGIGNSE
jgi:hypothetical protein